MYRCLIDGNTHDVQSELLREIDEGEMDEGYLIKHAPDYGKHGTLSVFDLAQVFVRRRVSWGSWVIKHPRSHVSNRAVLPSVQHR